MFKGGLRRFGVIENGDFETVNLLIYKLFGNPVKAEERFAGFNITRMERSEKRIGKCVDLLLAGR